MGTIYFYKMPRYGDMPIEKVIEISRRISNQLIMGIKNDLNITPECYDFFSLKARREGITKDISCSRSFLLFALSEKYFKTKHLKENGYEITEECLSHILNEFDKISAKTDSSFIKEDISGANDAILGILKITNFNNEMVSFYTIGY